VIGLPWILSLLWLLVDPGDAWVGFTAERVMILDGSRYLGRIWHMPGEQRHGEDLTALSPVLILRADSPSGRSYARNSTPSSNLCARKRFRS